MKADAIVAATDGSEQSLRAVEWAACEAARRGAARTARSRSFPSDVRPTKGAGKSMTMTSTGTVLGPTDLGRRVREHRCQAGLSQESAAALAGMSASYLRYLEISPSARPTLGGLARLADALGTSVEALTGADLGQAPGRTGGATGDEVRGGILTIEAEWELKAKEHGWICRARHSSPA
jgi:transcriptional regulator with XRE-family HTH domain